MLELRVFQDHNFAYKPFDSQMNVAKLNNAQKEAFVAKLSGKCVGCFNKPKDCAGLAGINEHSEMIDENGDTILVEYCPASSIQVEV